MCIIITEFIIVGVIVGSGFIMPGCIEVGPIIGRMDVLRTCTVNVAIGLE